MIEGSSDKTKIRRKLRRWPNEEVFGEILGID
jgi:hypothetical protein